MILDHRDPLYQLRRCRLQEDKYNGAFYYSREIVASIIPRVKTVRPWITVNTRGQGIDDAIVFVHNNLHPEKYDWLASFKNLVLVCGAPQTVKKVAHLGHAIYLPLSVDVEDVKKYRAPKTKESAYAGRAAKSTGIPPGVAMLSNMPRSKLLEAMAQYRRIYAVGRTAIEAKVLGCEVMAYDSRYPDPSLWGVLDNREAAVMLQVELDKIDGRKK